MKRRNKTTPDREAQVRRANQSSQAPLTPSSRDESWPQPSPKEVKSPHLMSD